MKQDSIKGGLKNHAHWVMALCCILPLLLIMLVFFGMKDVVPSWIIYLICPIGMIAVMIMMHSNNKKCHPEK